MSIGENIKKLRESHGLTQSQLGDIAGVSDKAVSTWESGSREPRMGAIEKIAQHFGLSKSEVLFGVVAEKNTDPKNGGLILMPEEEELVRNYRKAAPADQSAVNSILSKYREPPAPIARSAG